MTMSNRIAVMNQGHYEQLGDPETLYEHPTTRFVASFLGVSNLIRGTLDGTANGYALIRMADDTRVRVPAAVAAAADAGDRGPIEVGVRPEKIRISTGDEAVPPGHNRLAGTIADASYIGVSTQYIVEARGGARVSVYEQNVERATKAELWSPGEQVTLSWSPDHSFVVRESDSGALVEAS